jgi:hypothetical protein
MIWDLVMVEILKGVFSTKAYVGFAVVFDTVGDGSWVFGGVVGRRG